MLVLLRRMTMSRGVRDSFGGDELVCYSARQKLCDSSRWNVKTHEVNKSVQIYASKQLQARQSLLYHSISLSFPSNGYLQHPTSKNWEDEG
jgi:hypothetical protein